MVLYILIFVLQTADDKKDRRLVHVDVGGVISFVIENRVASATSGYHESSI
jgi:hypothetical protein